MQNLVQTNIETTLQDLLVQTNIEMTLQGLLVQTNIETLMSYLEMHLDALPRDARMGDRSPQMGDRKFFRGQAKSGCESCFTVSARMGDRPAPERPPGTKPSTLLSAPQTLNYKPCILQVGPASP